jgi:3-hydroxyisobutyrate dehydrogenase-like beta-hydroxyacid dehydrogenase
MGLPMAKNLLAAGHSVAAWNRTCAKAETLGSAHGAQVCDTPVAAAGDADVVILMLENGPICEQVCSNPASPTRCGPARLSST